MTRITCCLTPYSPNETIVKGGTYYSRSSLEQRWWSTPPSWRCAHRRAARGAPRRSGARRRRRSVRVFRRRTAGRRWSPPLAGSFFGAQIGWFAPAGKILRQRPSHTAARFSIVHPAASRDDGAQSPPEARLLPRRIGRPPRLATDRPRVRGGSSAANMGSKSERSASATSAEKGRRVWAEPLTMMPLGSIVQIERRQNSRSRSVTSGRARAYRASIRP